MKKLLPLILIGLIGILYLTALRVPYHFYKKAIQEGIESPFLSLRKLPDKFYSGQDYQFIKKVGVSTDQEDLWENLHFNDFIVPFPIRHPSFWVAPLIEEEAGEFHFGYKVLDYNLKTINVVIFRKREKFKLDLYKHRIFHLPLFEKKITSKGLKKTWEDVFKKDVYLSPHLLDKGFFDVTAPSQIPLTDMVYDLFLLSVRERFFPNRIKTINWWDKRSLGILEIEGTSEVEGSTKNFDSEVIFFLVRDQIYTIELKTVREDFAAEKYRQRLLDTLKYKRSEPDSSIPIYASFQNLPYQQKLTPNGLTYLFAAFSHNKSSENFLRQSIRFMERGRNDRVYLDPLYKYGFALYGTNFSKMMAKIKETAQEKLKRKIEEERELERSKLENMEILDEKETFKSEKEKIQIYLQRAKDSGESENDSKDLIID